MLNPIIGIRGKITSSILSGVIAEEEIIISDINHYVMEGKWIKSQLNHDAWGALFLNKKSCALTIGYKFWLGSKCPIQHNQVKMIWSAHK